MDWLNYHHLFYFWTVVREGSIAAACRKLLLSPATISAQLRELEGALGEKLFKRVGRNLAPTEFGRLAARYADEIFGLGQEFLDVAKGRTLETSLRFRLGVDDVLPKLVIARVLEAAFRLPQAIRLVCVEGTQSQLLPQLAVHDLDLVLSDAPADPSIKVRTFSHLLGESGITVCAVPALARRLRKGFPASLDGAPALLPTANTSLRRALDEWFESVAVRPRVIAEFEDLALLNACGHRGAGFFAVPDAVAAEITTGESVQAIGRMGKTRERLYAISVERRVKHPAAVALAENAAAVLRSAHRARTPGNPSRNKRR
ncbi:MAG: transcriptional activator NhaR [Gemmatimonadaceae bacterium]|nr:transcriptional activator NhaR [Gemmatimonadaceae bacterium]MCZ2098856.1 transcriptional activator NhaR [Anaerolineae bacterium]